MEIDDVEELIANGIRASFMSDALRAAMFRDLDEAVAAAQGASPRDARWP